MGPRWDRGDIEAEPYWVKHGFSSTWGGYTNLQVPYVPLPLDKRLEFFNIVKKIGRENFVEDKDVQVLEDDTPCLAIEVFDLIKGSRITRMRLHNDIWITISFNLDIEFKGSYDWGF
ncbi:hypothetical protein ACFE04_000721 [Oxalis oulophora]